MWAGIHDRAPSLAVLTYGGPTAGEEDSERAGHVSFSTAAPEPFAAV